MSRLALYLLGPPRLECDGAPVTFDTRKNLALIAYLAMTAEAHTREALITLLWPELEPSRARAGLRRNLSMLRKKLDRTLLVERETVGLDADLWVDVAQFRDRLGIWQAHDHPEAEVCPECLAALSEAVELYRGDFMAGFSLRDSAIFDEWQFFQTEGLRRELTTALERLVCGHSDRGEFEQAILCARRWSALDPLHEPVHRHLMQLYAWSGQQAAALRQYSECERVLEEELGVPPDEETSRLYNAIKEKRELPPRGGRIVAPLSVQTAARRHNLPAQLTPFVGRETALAEIDGRLGDPACRLLTLVGPGGSGKTRLALETAAARLEDYAHGVFFVPLAPLDSAEAILPAVAEALDLSLSASGEARQQLLDYVRQKALLLVLDNFEHLIAGGKNGGGVGLVTDILETAPNVQILVTSRARLKVGGEHLFLVAGMDFPASPPEMLADATRYSAVKLFLNSARRVQPSFELTADELKDVTHICRLVEGLPLGVLLAAAWVEMLSPGEIAAEITQSLDFLETDLRDVPERHRSMRAVFDHSWRLLVERDRELLRALSVFRGGFTREAAQEVAGASLRELMGLVNKSLLHRAPAPSTAPRPEGRYEMHEMLRQYAAEKLASTPEEDAVARDRHCAFYATFLGRWEADLVGASPVEALAAIRAEIANVRAAWHWAVKDARLKEIEQGLNGLSRYYLLIGPFQEGETLIGRAVERVRALVGQRGQAEREMLTALSRLLAEQASLLNRRGTYEQAIAAAQAAIDQISLVGKTDQTTHLEAEGHLRLGQALLYQGEFDAAQARLKQALALAQSASLSRVEADSLNSAGLAFYNQGDYAKARALLAQALPIYRQVGDRRGESSSLNNLGLVFFAQGDYKEAKAYYKQVLNACREIGDWQNEGVVLHNLGRILMQQGEYLEARAHLEQALRIYRRLGNRRGEGWGLLNLGRVALEQGNTAAARDYCGQALRVFCNIGARRGESLALINLGSASCQRGDYTEAATCLEQALLICREIGARLEEGWALSCLGDLLVGQGDYAGARVSLEQALSIYCEIGAREAEGWGLAALSLLYHHLGDDEAAREHGQRALSIAQELENRSLQGCVLTNLGHALVGLGRPSEAAVAYEQALVLRRELGLSNLAMEPLAGLARIALAQDNLPQAQAQIGEILSYLEIDDPSASSTERPEHSERTGHALDGLDEPVRIYLTCYRVLRATQDPRALEILSAAHNLLQERAAKISDEELRRSFLENVAAHREIVEVAIKAGLG